MSYQELFDLLHQEANYTALESDMRNIINCVHKNHPDENQSEALKVAKEALEEVKYPCEDCRFYSKCDRESYCRTKTNFLSSQALTKIKELED
jgi:hypothetical protein